MNRAGDESTNLHMDQDEQDRVLADFLDWLDTRDAAQRDVDLDGATSPTDGSTVETFLQDRGIRCSKELRETLLQFVIDDDRIGEVAASAALTWIDAAQVSKIDSYGMSSEAELALPCPFGDYQLLEVVGRGGMGIVYKATQESLNRSVCVKLAPVGKETRARLLREAELAGSLHHPNIVSVFDTGIVQNRSFIAMEFVDGQPLSTYLKDPLAGLPAATMLNEIGSAIEFAHDNNVLHRDLKPANVIVDVDGRLRVTDFGLAKRIVRGTDSPTESLDGIVGSPSYMSPEQVRGEAVDVRTDIYGLGAILYEMLSGRPPLVGHSSLDTLRLVESTDPVPLSRLRPGLPKDLETICHKCLQKRRQNRYPSVADLRDDLQRFLAGQPVVARPIGSFLRTVRWVKRNPSPSIAAAVATLSLVTVIVVGGLLLWQTQNALTRTSRAELEQRRLAGDLRDSIILSNRSLYQSLIAQAAQAMASNDVLAARRSLSEIRGDRALLKLARIEYNTLCRRAWPASDFVAFDQAIADLAWNPQDDTLLVLTEDGRLLTQDAELALDLTRDSLVSTRLVISPDGRFAAVLGQDRIAIVGLSPLHLVTILQNEGVMRNIAWHSTGDSLLALSQRSQLWVNDVNSGVAVRFSKFAGPVREFSVSPDGQLVAALVGRKLQITSWGEEDDIATLGFDDRWPLSLRWLDDSTIAVLNEFGLVTAFQQSSPRSGLAFERSWSIETVVRQPQRLDMTAAQLLVIGEEDIVAIALGQPASIVWQHPLPPTKMLRVGRNETARIALQESESSSVEIWSLDRLATKDIIHQGDVPVRKVAIGDSGQITAWRDLDGMVTVVNPDWDDPVQIRESLQPTTGLAMSPKGPLLAASRETEVTVYRLPEVSQEFRVTGHNDTVWSLTFDSAGKYLATGDNKGKVVVTDMAGAMVSSFQVGDRDIRSLAFFPKGDRLAAADNGGRLFACDLRTKSVERLESSHLNDVTALAISSDGRICAADSSGTIWCSGAGEGEPEVSWSAHSGPIWDLQCSGQRILSASQDGKLRIWDRQGNLALTLADMNEPIWSMEHDPGTNRLLAATTTGSVFKVDCGRIPSAAGF